MTVVPLPGFLATGPGVGARTPGVPAGSVRTTHGGVTLTRWGLRPIAADPVLALSCVRRTSAGGEIGEGELVGAARAGEAGAMLPPFATARGDTDGVSMAADWAGFRQLYHGVAGGAMSTSALAAGWALGAAVDHRSVAVQSQLGWQLAQRTLFEGVAKLAPGATARLDGAGVTITDPAPTHRGEIAVEAAVAEAAALLRAAMEKLLDDHPDAVLQLSGGFDSRLLLSAVPPSRRRGLRAMTLGDDGDGDVDVARAIAARCGLDHEVHSVADISTLPPEDAWRRVRDASLRVDAQSDPLAVAALGFAEERFAQGVRISGVGGEVARGFYYLGRVRDRRFTRADARRLAAWRMFVNEAVEPGMLAPEFAAWGRQVAEDEAFAALRSGGDEWYRATDALFLGHRVQRWAGTNDTAVWDRRPVVNPMLDERFLQLVTRLAPRDKAHSRFFARLQMELDPELGGMPLDGRPSPASYAQPGFANSVRRHATTGRKLARKVTQRARRGNRPVTGSSALAALVAAHWREQSSILDPLSASGDVVDRTWLERVVSGDLLPRPSSAALLTNLVVLAG